MRLAFGVASVLVAVLFAGCGDDAGPQVITLPSGEEVKVEEPVKKGNGYVHGLVGDDAIQLLDDVYVRLVNSEYNTRTGADGTFLLVNVKPGIYVLEGSKKDYATVQTTVDVHPGEVAKSVLLMERLPSSDPFCFTKRHESHIDAGGGAFTTIGGNGTDITIDLDRNPSGVVIEAQFTGTMTGAGESPLYYNMEVLRNRDWYIDGYGPNPFRMIVEGRAIPPEEPLLTVDVTPNWPGQLVFLTDGVLLVTVFVNADPPGDWSVIDGDSCSDFNLGR